MNVAAVITLLTALFKAVPIMEAWWEQVLVEWIKYRKIQLKKETIKAINEALKDQDQRGLEHEDYSGKPSGIGAIRDSLPGVRNSKKD